MDNIIIQVKTVGGKNDKLKTHRSGKKTEYGYDEFGNIVMIKGQNGKDECKYKYSADRSLETAEGGETRMNIFDLARYTWWENMELLFENVNLSEVSIIRNNCILFKFSNSYNGKFYRSLRCEQIIKCSIDNEAYCNEEFAYFVPDVYIRELSGVEIESSLKYYKDGYNMISFGCSDIEYEVV